MTAMKDDRLEAYYRDAESWAQDRQKMVDRSVRLAWIVASVAGIIALVEAFALFLLIPLKREVPYTLLVDKQTGYVQALRPLDAETVSPDAALTRSFLVQYVIARESFDIDSLQEDYRKVGLWSAGEARDRYIALMNAGNARGPLATLPRRAVVSAEIRSISSLSRNTALVRFSTVRTDPGGQPVAKQHWAAILTYRYAQGEMSAADRLINPLGFQVTRYRRDAEALPEERPQPAAQAQAPVQAPPLAAPQAQPMVGAPQ